ncbi:G5 domain-containing protein [Candidatus Saccharibacteria bacterium]|nr:G5 domain-containing protein [Candidatus Saccharibacteria bacterium]
MPKTFASDEESFEDEEHSYVLSSSEHFVTVFDNGTKKTVKTEAKTVEELLSRLSIPLSSTDTVSPSLDTEIDADHFFINIYRSRPVLVLDGAVSKVIDVSSYDPLTALRSAGFTIYDEDKLEVASIENFLESGFTSAYKIVRGDGQTSTEEEDLPFETETITDYDIPSGSEQVKQLGELGKVKKVYKVRTVNGEVVEKELISEEVIRAPKNRIVAIGATKISASPLTPSMGRNRYTSTNLSGQTVERQETFYDLPMSGVMAYCGKSSYTVREDGAKIDDEGFVIVAAELSRYPRCSVVETSLGKGKVYDTGGFAATNPEQFDLATDWTNRNGI